MNLNYRPNYDDDRDSKEWERARVAASRSESEQSPVDLQELQELRELAEKLERC
jgi:hypothetical protein